MSVFESKETPLPVRDGWAYAKLWKEKKSDTAVPDDAKDMKCFQVESTEDKIYTDHNNIKNNKLLKFCEDRPLNDWFQSLFKQVSDLSGVPLYQFCFLWHFHWYTNDKSYLMIFHTNEFCDFDDASLNLFDEIVDTEFSNNSMVISTLEYAHNFQDNFYDVQPTKERNLKLRTVQNIIFQLERGGIEKMKNSLCHKQHGEEYVKGGSAVNLAQCENNGSCVSYEKYKHTIVYSSETNKFYYIPNYEIYLRKVFARWFEIIANNPNFKLEKQLSWIHKQLIQAFDLDTKDSSPSWEKFNDGSLIVNGPNDWKPLGDQVVLAAPFKIYWEKPLKKKVCKNGCREITLGKGVRTYW